jgi:hypothetical protein
MLNSLSGIGSPYKLMEMLILGGIATHKIETNSRHCHSLAHLGRLMFDNFDNALIFNNPLFVGTTA